MFFNNDVTKFKNNLPGLDAKAVTPKKARTYDKKAERPFGEEVVVTIRESYSEGIESARRMKSEMDDLLVQFRKRDQGFSDKNKTTGEVELDRKTIDRRFFNKNGQRTLTGEMKFNPESEDATSLDAFVNVRQHGAVFTRKYTIRNEGSRLEYQRKDWLKGDDGSLNVTDTLHIDKKTGAVLKFETSKTTEEWREPWEYEQRQNQRLGDEVLGKQFSRFEKDGPDSGGEKSIITKGEDHVEINGVKLGINRQYAMFRQAMDRR